MSVGVIDNNLFKVLQVIGHMNSTSIPHKLKHESTLDPTAQPHPHGQDEQEPGLILQTVKCFVLHCTTLSHLIT